MKYRLIPAPYAEAVRNDQQELLHRCRSDRGSSGPAHDALCTGQDRRAARHAVAASLRERWIMRKQVAVGKTGSRFCCSGAAITSFGKRDGAIWMPALPPSSGRCRHPLSGAVRFLLVELKLELNNWPSTWNSQDSGIQKAADKTKPVSVWTPFGIGPLTVTALITAIRGRHSKSSGVLAWVGLVPWLPTGGGRSCSASVNVKAPTYETVCAGCSCSSAVQESSLPVWAHGWRGSSRRACSVVGVALACSACGMACGPCSPRAKSIGLRCWPHSLP